MITYLTLCVILYPIVVLFFACIASLFFVCYYTRRPRIPPLLERPVYIPPTASSAYVEDRYTAS